MPQRLPKIKSITVYGSFDHRRVTPLDYEKTRDEFSKGRTGITLPTWGQLDKIGDLDELWALLKAIEILITFKGGKWMRFKFLRGFIYDRTSTPVGRNNRLAAVIATLIHDACFSLHMLEFLETHEHDNGFRASNKLFYRIMRCKRVIGADNGRTWERMPWPTAVAYYLAVNSTAGRACYAKAVDRAFWHEKTVEFTKGGWR